MNDQSRQQEYARQLLSFRLKEAAEKGVTAEEARAIADLIADAYPGDQPPAIAEEKAPAVKPDPFRLIQRRGRITVWAAGQIEKRWKGGKCIFTLTVPRGINTVSARNAMLRLMNGRHEPDRYSEGLLDGTGLKAYIELRGNTLTVLVDSVAV